jgi:hypothetical protein
VGATGTNGAGRPRMKMADDGAPTSTQQTMANGSGTAMGIYGSGGGQDAPSSKTSSLR